MSREGRPPGRLRQRLATATGTAELEVLERRLAPVEEAMAENAALSVPLERHVSELENGLVPMLEKALGERRHSPGD